MSKKFSIWLVILISVIALAFIASGCAKKQVVKETAGAKPPEARPAAPVTPPPAPAPAPRAEAPPAPAPAPAPAAPERRPEAAPPAPARPAPAPAPGIALKEMTIWFAFDDYNLSTKSKENLERIAAWMQRNPGAKIQVQGNTCDIGTAEYNLALGEKRATSAKKYLEGLGVGGNRVATISYGEERPMLPNKGESNRSKNRRDEFVEGQ